MLTCARCGSSVALPADPRALTTACGKCGSPVDLASMRTIADAPVAPSAPADDLLPAGRTLAGYRIEQMLGRGGMATVYKATQLSLSRPVAIKVLPRALAQNPAFVARFNREAGALAALSHPNIINIIDRGVEGDVYYFIMEFVDGTDLQGVIAKGRPAPAEAVRILAQVLGALDYAHKRGVIHRDIKPGNIMIDRYGTVKVTDFGIAHLAGTQDTGFGLTMAGAAMGTVNYMAPEQRTDARNVDARADLYAAGVVLYELLTGQLPLGAFEPASQLSPGVDPRLDSVITKSLKQDPKARFPGAQDFLMALTPLAAAAPPPEKPPEPAPTNFPCPQCKAENRADAKYCVGCGKTLIESCPKCRKNMRAGAKFCDACGTNIGQYLTQFRENLKTRLTTAAGYEKESRLPEALGEVDAILAAEGPELEEVKSKAEELKRRVVAAKEKIDTQFQAGQRFYDAKDYEKAAAQWKKLPPALSYVKDALGEAQKKIDAREKALAAATAAHAAGRFEEALADWQKAAELVADAAPFRAKMDEAREKVAVAKYLECNKRGTAAAAARDFAGAAAAWAEALRWKPDDPVAKSELQKAEIQKRAAEREALIAKGDQAIAAGRAKEAIDCWQKAIALLVPDNPQIRSSLEQKLSAARARQSQDMKKLLLFGGIGAGALLFIVVVIVAIVLIAGKDNKSSSSSSGGGGSGSSPKAAQTPEELYGRIVKLLQDRNLDGIWALRCTGFQPSREQFDLWFQNVFQPWNDEGGVDPRQMQAAPPVIQANQAAVYWQAGYVRHAFLMVKEPDGWKFAGAQ